MGLAALPLRCRAEGRPRTSASPRLPKVGLLHFPERLWNRTTKSRGGTDCRQNVPWKSRVMDGEEKLE